MDVDERNDDNVFENDPAADDAWADPGDPQDTDAEATQVLPAAEDDPEATAVLGTPDAAPAAEPVAADEVASEDVPAGETAVFAEAPVVTDDEAAAAAPAAVAAPAASGRGRRTGLIIALALLLIALAIGGWFWWDSSQKAAREQAIRDTSTAYLSALTNADAAAALDTLAEQPANTTLLTNDVLAASRTRRPSPKRPWAR